MRNKIFSSAVVMLAILSFGSPLFSQDHKHDAADQKITIIGAGEMLYKCPMKSDLVYSSQPGECTICGMELKEMTEDDKKNLNELMMAQGMMQQKSGDLVTITGEVVGSACYIRDGIKGEKHAKCAIMCAEAGGILSILDETSGKLIIPIAKRGKNPNELLLQFVGQRVSVKGTYLDKNGLTGIEISSVEKAKK